MTVLRRCELFQSVCMAAAAAWFFLAGGTMTTGAQLLFIAYVLPIPWMMPEHRRAMLSKNRAAPKKTLVCCAGLVSCLAWTGFVSDRGPAERQHLMDVVMALCGAMSLMSLARVVSIRRRTARS